MPLFKALLLIPWQLLRLIWWLLRRLLRLLARAMGLEWQFPVRTGEDYEHYVCFYLDRQGFSRIQHTGGTGDLGVDLVAHKGRRTYAVQCKYYSQPVNGAAVQEVVAGMAAYGCDAALIVTNNTLTSGAWTLAQVNDVEVMEHVSPDQDGGFSVQTLITPKNLVCFALGWTFFGVCFSHLYPLHQMGLEAYFLLALGCLALTWGVVTGILHFVHKLLHQVHP